MVVSPLGGKSLYYYSVFCPRGQEEKRASWNFFSGVGGALVSGPLPAVFAGSGVNR
jgi:hypothetical protein